MKPVLQLSNIKLSFDSPKGKNEILHGVSLYVNEGEKVALVGESGSGKSVTARIAMSLLGDIKGCDISGDCYFNGQEQRHLPKKTLQAQRGKDMSMIFQDPTSALNPIFKIGDQFFEVIKRGHHGISRADAHKLAVEALAKVSIPEPERVLDSFVFQLSGGMNQRIMIAMALINNPKLLIADEPGTALDVTVQAQTLELMRDRTSQEGAAVLFISHNLGVVREFADRIYVIYRGNIVEHGRTEQIFDNPTHPYTRMLLSAMPRITGEKLVIETGDPYAPRFVHEGCEEPEIAHV